MKIVYVQDVVMWIMRQKETIHSGLNLHAIAAEMFGITVMMAESMQKTVKPKKCRVCKESFKPFQTTQAVCSIKCARSHAQSTIEKKTRKDTREKKQSLKTRSEWIKDAQQAVNAYVRIRDQGKPCCSCDRPDDGSHQRHASHYRSTKACSSLRFNTLNIWASCAQCNTMESGNLIEYRIRLQRRQPGLPDWLESQNDVVRYDIDYLKRLIAIFRKKTRLYQRLRNEMAP